MPRGLFEDSSDEETGEPATTTYATSHFLGHSFNTMEFGRDQKPLPPVLQLIDPLLQGKTDFPVSNSENQFVKTQAENIQGIRMKALSIFGDSDSSETEDDKGSLDKPLKSLFLDFDPQKSRSVVPKNDSSSPLASDNEPWWKISDDPELRTKDLRLDRNMNMVLQAAMPSSDSTSGCLLPESYWGNPSFIDFKHHLKSRGDDRVSKSRNFGEPTFYNAKESKLFRSASDEEFEDKSSKLENPAVVSRLAYSPAWKLPDDNDNSENCHSGLPVTGVINKNKHFEPFGSDSDEEMDSASSVMSRPKKIKDDSEKANKPVFGKAPASSKTVYQLAVQMRDEIFADVADEPIHGKQTSGTNIWNEKPHGSMQSGGLSHRELGATSKLTRSGSQEKNQGLALQKSAEIPIDSSKFGMKDAVNPKKPTGTPPFVPSASSGTVAVGKAPKGFFSPVTTSKFDVPSNASPTRRLEQIKDPVPRKCRKGHCVQAGVKCKELCSEPNNCKKHYCKRPCEPGHYNHDCPEQIIQKLNCGHEMEVVCCELASLSLPVCDIKTEIVFACGHKGVGVCSDNGVNVCKMLVLHQFLCGHSRKLLCNGVSPICKEECSKSLVCGHPCPNHCGEPCLTPEQCSHCIEEAKARDDSEREAHTRKAALNRKMAMENAAKLKDDLASFKVKELEKSSPMYLDVCDKVLKYVQPTHSWYPEITKVEEVINSRLLSDYYKCQSEMVDSSYTTQKFHGTDNAACQLITRNGFRLPSNDGIQRMFGCGIYFATDASKSAQQQYTKGSNTLLLCDVLIGRAMEVSGPVYDMTLQKLRRSGFDSVFARRGTQQVGGVLFDEFVVYDTRQAYPKYVVHYKAVSMNIAVQQLSSGGFQKHELFPKRSYSNDDPLDMHFRVAESQFLRLGSNLKLAKVTYAFNPTLIKQFNDKVAEFQAKYGVNSDEARPILAFHGTPVQTNIDLILQNNFQSSFIKRCAYGRGHYFSEFPNVSVSYASGVKALLLCQVLAGRSQDVISGINIGPGFDSNRVQKDTEGRGQMIIVANEQQILPCYVVHLQ